MASKLIRVCTVLMLIALVTLGSPSEIKQVDEPKTNLAKYKEGHTLVKRHFDGFNYGQAYSLAHNLNFNNVRNSAGLSVVPNYAPVQADASLYATIYQAQLGQQIQAIRQGQLVQGLQLAQQPQLVQQVVQQAPIIQRGQLVQEFHQITPLVRKFTVTRPTLIIQRLSAPQVPQAQLSSAQLSQLIEKIRLTAVQSTPARVLPVPQVVQPVKLVQQVQPAPQIAQPVTFVQQIAAPQAGVAAHATDPLPTVVNGLSVHRLGTPEAGDSRPVAGFVQLYKFAYPFVIAAQLDNFTFSCRQDIGFLVINEQLPGGIIRNQQINAEFVYHPAPGIWWFVKCVGFESGYGLDMTGVSKPGGDAGIDPNALKSLVG